MTGFFLVVSEGDLGMSGGYWGDWGCMGVSGSVWECLKVSEGDCGV